MTEPTPPINATHPYASFIDQVDKPSRYIGGEFGSHHNAWDSAENRVCLAFPDVYDIGMSHLGFRILYELVNKQSGCLADRVYTPWDDMEAQLRARSEPLRSLESAKPLSDFDVVGFSLQFELTYTNILLMLELGGVPRRAADRTEAHPLVIAGGPTATHAEPMAAFIDAFVIGDGEESLLAITRLWTAQKKLGTPRLEALRALSKIPGVYVPSLYQTHIEPETGLVVVSRPSSAEFSDVLTPPFPIRRTIVSDLNKYPFPSVGPVASTETIFDRVSVEISRGCTEGCRFCQAGMIYRPVRERSPQSIVKTVEDAIAQGGYDEASLTSLSTADYSAIHPLVKTIGRKLDKKNVSMSVSSLRAYGLDEELLDELRSVRASGLTFAPEAGSQRMRDVVNKNVTEEQLMTTAQRVFSRGWSKMKLYFMIGLPTEEEEDIREIVRTGGRARDVGRKAQPRGNPDVTVSVSVHVPKPHTPFQWCAMDTREQVFVKQKWLEEETRIAKTKLRTHSAESSWLEGVLARGDRTLADVIESAYLNGARFDSWEDRHKRTAWQKAFSDHNVDPEKYLGTIPVSARLPWDHIDVGLEEGFLLSEYRKAVKSRLSPPCGKAAGMFVHHTNLESHTNDGRRLVCYDCGVGCDLSAMKTERADFLVSLGAKEESHDEPKVLRVVGRPAIGTLPKTIRKIRVHFGKTGAFAFRGHLDVVRLLPRVFKRAGLALHYTEGFHPRPEMVFGPALPLGVYSVAEYVDVRIETDFELPDEPTVLAALNSVSESGLLFYRMREIQRKEPSLTKTAAIATYLIGVPTTLRFGGAPIDEVFIENLVATSSPLPDVIRQQGKVTKTIQVSKFVEGLRRCDSSELTQIGVVGQLLAIEAKVRVTPDGTSKVTEIVQSLFRDFPSELPLLPMVRTRYELLLGKLTDPFDGIQVAMSESAVPASAESLNHAASLSTTPAN